MVHEATVKGSWPDAKPPVPRAPLVVQPKCEQKKKSRRGKTEDSQKIREALQELLREQKQGKKKGVPGRPRLQLGSSALLVKCNSACNRLIDIVKYNCEYLVNFVIKASSRQDARRCSLHYFASN